VPRCLSVSRATVRPEREAEYLATVRALARELGRRGQHLWLFRSETDPHTYVEFSESGSPAAHRTRASRLPREQELETRLRALVTYAPDAWARWDEVSLDAAPAAADQEE
jgi:hypothetical protein